MDLRRNKILLRACRACRLQRSVWEPPSPRRCSRYSTTRAASVPPTRAGLPRRIQETSPMPLRVRGHSHFASNSARLRSPSSRSSPATTQPKVSGAGGATGRRPHRGVRCRRPSRTKVRAPRSTSPRRGHVGTGDNILVAGFVISGAASRRVLIRAVGPSLAQFGLTACWRNHRSHYSIAAA